MKLIKPIAAVFLLMLAANVSAQTEKETHQKEEAEEEKVVMPEGVKPASGTAANAKNIRMNMTKLEAASKQPISEENPNQEVKKEGK